MIIIPDEGLYVNENMSIMQSYFSVF